MLRMLGYGLIFAGSLGLGDIKARESGLRVRQLQEWQRILLILQGELRGIRLGLPEICEQLVQDTKPPFSIFFSNMSADLKERAGKQAGEIWSRNLCLIRDQLYLNQREWQDLEEFGQLLGRIDLALQMDMLTLYQEKARQSLAEAKETARVRQRLYRYLGALGGLALILVIL